MKQWFKITIKLLIAVGVVLLLGYGGCRGLLHVIIESNSCDRFNIDNIESRIPVGIPSVSRKDPDCLSCILDKAANTKTNYFKIRTDVVDMDGYVERNFFIPIDDVDLNLSVFERLTKTPKISSDNLHNFYYSLGIDKRIRTDWLAILDKSNGDLWIYMKYKD